MDAIFLKILNMSIAASFLIFSVIILRLVLKNAPKWIRCIMWSMVGARLIIPFSFESKLSLIPNAQKLSNTSYSSTAYISNSTPVMTETISTSQNSSIDILSIVGIIWVIGVVAMLVYMLYSYLKIIKTTQESIQLNDNIWICDHINSPFVLGFFNPKIYLLSSLNEDEQKYVVAHEQAHLKRMDNFWKPLGFVLLCIHWFNPICWVAYWLFNKDIELACDENVIKALDTKGKKAYSTALLSCSTDRHTLSACPLSFGENNVKQRIKSVLSYRKPTVYVITVSLTVCVVTALLFMTNPVSSANAKNAEPEVKKTTIAVETVAETTMPETTVIPTETTVETNPSTVPPTEPEATEAVVEESESNESYVEESYEDDSYYEESYYEEDNYDDESYDDNSDYEKDGEVEIVPFDPYRNLEEEIEAQREAFSSGNYIRGYHNFSNFGQTPPSYNDPDSPDFQIAWDPF